MGGGQLAPTPNSGLPALADLIGSVGCVITQEQVIWPHAGWVVAGVENEQPVWDSTGVDLPRHSMSPTGGLAHGDPELAVAVREATSRPDPTTIWGGLIYLGPEAFFHRSHVGSVAH